MLRRLRSHRPNHASVVAYLALFLALGGTAYAAATIGSAQVVDNSLESRDLRDNAAVQSRDVLNDNLTGGGLRAQDLAPGAVGASDVQTGAVTKAKLRPPEPWRAATLSSSTSGSWVNRPGYSPVAFYKDPQGVVRLRGVACRLPSGVPFCGSDAIGFDRIFTLPAGYRSARPIKLAVVSENDLGIVYIDEDGLVAATRGSYGAFSLDGVQFRACGEPNADAC